MQLNPGQTTLGELHAFWRNGGEVSLPDSVWPAVEASAAAVQAALKRDRPTYGTNTGATAATVIGGIVGAVVGSKVGGGSARYATSALGSMVGGMAGKQIYEQTQRNRAANQRVGVARACDPVPVGAYESGRGATTYDVTYEYGGRNYTTRTSYHPGDRIRVRVDVRPE